MDGSVEQRLIEAFYEAPLSGWNAAVDALATAFQAHAGCFVVAVRRGGWRGDLAASWGLSPETSAAYATRFGALDPYLAKAAVGPPIACLAQAECVDRGTQLRSEYYNDFEIPGGLTGNWMGGVFLRDETGLVGLGMYRGRNQGEFGTGDRTLLERLAPHIHRAARIYRRVGETDAAAAVAGDILDRLDIAIVVLSPGGLVLRTNAAAEALSVAGDGFALGLDGPRAASPGETNALRKLVHDAAASGRGGERALPRPSGRRPYLATVVPGGKGGAATGDRSVVLFISDPDRAPVASASELLTRFFRLTPAEARVAIEVAQDAAPKEVAARLGVCVATVRTQLKSVFAKMGISRQSDLARIVARLPPR